MINLLERLKNHEVNGVKYSGLVNIGNTEPSSDEMIAVMNYYEELGDSRVMIQEDCSEELGDSRVMIQEDCSELDPNFVCNLNKSDSRNILILEETVLPAKLQSNVALTLLADILDTDKDLDYFIRCTSEKSPVLAFTRRSKGELIELNKDIENINYI